MRRWLGARGIWLLIVTVAVGVATAVAGGRDTGAPVAPPVEVAAAQVTPAVVPNGVAFAPDDVDEAARELPRLHSLLVSREGELLFEKYYNGTTASRPANIKSASKSVISALVGIALERGLIPGVRTPLVTYFPELARDPDARKREITVEDLLTMRSGLEGTSNRNYGRWVLSPNWVQHALNRPMLEAPGELTEYSTGNTHLLSAILTKVSSTSTWDFANEALAKPLGFTLSRWPRDPQGIYFGGNDMLMTPRQLVAFGELYLNKGRVDGRQVVPEQWVAQSCQGKEREFRSDRRRPGGVTDPMRDRRYGYGWWVHDIEGYDTCFAWGYGGQYVFVVPALDVVVVTTASPDVSEDRRGHRQMFFDILSRLVIEPLAAGQS